MILDLLLAALIVLAVLIGYKRGTLNLLLAEVGFFGLWWLALSHWPSSLHLFGSGVPLLGLVGLLIVLFLSLLAARFLGRLGSLLGRMPMLQGPDGLLGIFIHPLIALLIGYSILSAFLSVGQVISPALAGDALTAPQAGQINRQLAAHKIVSRQLDSRDLARLRSWAATMSGGDMSDLPSLRELLSVDKGVIQPQLRSSHLAPIILAMGRHLSPVHHFGPSDLPGR
ncbi:MAG: hypothetical protein ACREN8_08310 [Candidatus Dormibacteraceae bacterium]